MSNWSIETLDDGRYGLVLTQGKQSRTVFLAFQMGDAAEFLAMAEVYALVRSGAPVEAFAKFTEQPKKRSRRAKTS